MMDIVRERKIPAQYGMRELEQDLEAFHGEDEHAEDELDEGKGLWDNIRAKRARGEKPAKPGDEDYPDKKQWDKLTKKSKKK